MNWRQLIDLAFNGDGELVFVLGPIALIVIGLLLLAIILWTHPWTWVFARLEPVQLDVNLGGIGKVSIKPTYEDIQIAHRVWVELATRKAGLAFDPENDVIVEIYDSWYDLFLEMRSLAKDVPAHRLRRDDTRKIVDLVVDALNRGLRPHLTRWQARFRHWYDRALKANPESSPQEVQRLYPDYDNLVDDLKRVNGDLQHYMAELKRLAIGPKRS